MVAPLLISVTSARIQSCFSRFPLQTIQTSSTANGNADPIVQTLSIPGGWFTSGTGDDNFATQGQIQTVDLITSPTPVNDAFSGYRSE